MADRTSGSSVVTNEATVNVTTFSGTPGDQIAGYMITETADEPAADDPGWSGTVPATCSISGGVQPPVAGTVILYGWMKDAAGTVSGATTSILFSTAVPAVSNVAVTDDGDGTATATWTTDVAAQGGANCGQVTMGGATPNSVIESAAGTSHSVVLTGIAAGTNCKIILVNNELASPAFYWPLAWPIDGDANQDCRVNILDLIFIRNKLNQAVGTGDNWKADVNEDTRINILDLIYVRNKLNTSCAP